MGDVRPIRGERNPPGVTFSARATGIARPGTASVRILAAFNYKLGQLSNDGRQRSDRYGFGSIVILAIEAMSAAVARSSHP
jgi:hypothetical protein